MTDLHVETDLEGLPNLLQSGKREKDVSANLSWSFLSDVKATVVRPNKISSQSVHGSLNLVAHHLSQIGCFYQFLDKRGDQNVKVWLFRKDLKSIAPCKIKILKDFHITCEVLQNFDFADSYTLQTFSEHPNFYILITSLVKKLIETSNL